MEDKQKILDALLPALQLTRGAKDLKSLTYQPRSADVQYVKAEYQNGAVRMINVSIDSGIAMIRDVCTYVV